MAAFTAAKHGDEATAEGDAEEDGEVRDGPMVHVLVCRSKEREEEEQDADRSGGRAARYRDVAVEVKEQHDAERYRPYQGGSNLALREKKEGTDRRQKKAAGRGAAGEGSRRDGAENGGPPWAEEEVDGKQGEGDDTEVLESGHRPIESLGVVELEEQKGDGEKQEEAPGEILFVREGVAPENCEDKQGGEVSESDEEGEIEVMEGDEFEGDDGVHEQEFVLAMLCGGDVEQLAEVGRELLEVLGKAEEGGVVVQEWNGSGLTEKDGVREQDGGCGDEEEDKPEHPGDGVRHGRKYLTAANGGGRHGDRLACNGLTAVDVQAYRYGRG